MFLYVICTVSVLLSTCFGEIEYIKPFEKWPTVGISILVRNKAHSLPYFLSSLIKLEYPKERIYLWIYSDFNSDNSDDIIKEWCATHESKYHHIFLTTNTSTSALYIDQETSTHWSQHRYRHVIAVREEALGFAKTMWADHLFMLDADVILTEPLTLKYLINKEYPISAPMLISDGVYSNFWCGMDQYYYYKRTEDYRPILRHKKVGCFDVPMVHSAVLINLKYEKADLLTYVPENIKNYNGPEDDIIAFAISATKNGIPMYICNDHIYGFVPVPLEKDSYPQEDYEEIRNVKMEALGRGTRIPLDKHLEKYVKYQNPDKLTCSEIFMINLERRQERRELMKMSFKELGLNVSLFEAVDGKSLTKEEMLKYNIKLLPNYEDPYHKRPMKAGEIGCFLSHYLIWQKIVEHHYDTTLILEDDIHFVPFFRQKFLRMLEEIKDIEWDLIYIGRKILLDSEEPQVTYHTTRPKYSYWTLGYLLRESGAKKLLEADPLSKLLPVDEYIPIMFDQHPMQDWAKHFPVRNLIALSSAPLLVHPTHYTGEKGYISDTEDSNVVDDKKQHRTDL